MHAYGQYTRITCTIRAEDSSEWLDTGNEHLTSRCGVCNCVGGEVHSQNYPEFWPPDEDVRPCHKLQCARFHRGRELQSAARILRKRVQ